MQKLEYLETGRILRIVVEIKIVLIIIYETVFLT